MVTNTILAEGYSHLEVWNKRVWCRRGELYWKGLLNSLMTWAIPLPMLDGRLSGE